MLTRAVRAELRKFFTTRLWWGMALGIFLAGAAFSALFAVLYTLPPQEGMPVGSQGQVANSVYTAGLSVGYLLLLTIGVLQIGSEYRHKTITSTFLATPHRALLMLAKVLALLLLGALYGLISLIGSVTVGAATLTLRGGSAFPDGVPVRTLALSLLVLGLWALIGLGVGILIPNQVAALLIGIGVAWIVEPILTLALRFWSWGNDHIAPYLPSSATNAVIDGLQQQGEVRLSWYAAALVLAAYAAVLAGFGAFRAVRQDVA